jgi:hypothetical protein
MIINGCFYSGERINQTLSDLKLAVSRLPADAPLRPHFDFLLGLLDAIEVEAEEQEDSAHKLNVALDDLSEARSATQKALEGLGEIAPDDFDEALIKLIELAQKNGARTRELYAVRP